MPPPPFINVVFNNYDKENVENCLARDEPPEILYPNGSKDEFSANLLLGNNENLKLNKYRFFTNIFKHGYFNYRFSYHSVNNIPDNNIPFCYIYPIHIFNFNFYNYYSTNPLYIPEKVVSDIKNSRAKLVFISDEGNEANTEIIKMLDNVRQTYSFSYKSIFFLNCNYLIEKILNNKYNGIYYNPWQFNTTRLMEVGYKIEEIKNNINSKKKRNNKILCFNRNNHAHRAYLIDRILELNLEKDSLITYLNIGSNNNFWKSPKFLKTLTYDEKGNDRAPININLEAHISSYVNVVTETLFETNTNNTVFFSEKIFKPIICLQPFILVGQAHGLKYLKEMGYKTFDPFIDESYDNIENPIDRLEAIIEQIKIISNMSWEQLNNLLCDLYPILLHNFTNHVNLVKSHYDGSEIINKIIERW